MNDAEYQVSNSAVTANALSAYQAGFTGRGVKVAVIDTGINPNLPEFTGRIDPASQDVAASRGISDHQNHGTMVSGVLAANRDGQYMQGVAYEATILSLNVYDPAGCKPGNDCFLDSAIDEAIDLARTNGARIINMSFGDEEGMTADVWPAIQRAVDAGLIIIMSAGNGGRANPNGFATQNIQNNGASGLFIIAGAMDANRNMATFSDLAGATAAANWYLTALGVANATVNRFGTHVNVNGTSFSAPTIAGAAALLASAFPNLTARQIVQLLLTTADDAGASGTDPLYGRGILNIGRAVQPQGTMSLAGSAERISLAVNGMTSGPMGDASSRASARAVVLDGYSRAYVLDLAKTLGRAPGEQPLHQGVAAGIYRSGGGIAGPITLSFTVRQNAFAGRSSEYPAIRGEDEDSERAPGLVAGSAITRLSGATALAFGVGQSGRSLQQQMSGNRPNAFIAAEDPAARTGFHALRARSLAVRQELGALALGLSSESGRSYDPRPDARRKDTTGYRLDGLSLDYAAGTARFNLGVTRLAEDRTILGSRLTDAFAAGGSTTHFLDASASVGIGDGWSAAAAYRHGLTSVGGTAGLIDGGRLRSQAFAADLFKRGLFGASDSLSFRFAQPLRVARGGIRLNLPTSYDYDSGQAGFGSRFLNLAPSGRELDYEVAYSLPMLGGYISLNGYLRAEPGHIGSARRDLGAAARFTIR